MKILRNSEGIVSLRVFGPEGHHNRCGPRSRILVGVAACLLTSDLHRASAVVLVCACPCGTHLCCSNRESAGPSQQKHGEVVEYLPIATLTTARTRYFASDGAGNTHLQLAAAPDSWPATFGACFLCRSWRGPESISC